MDALAPGASTRCRSFSHRLPLEEAAYGYELFDRREATKVLLIP